MSHNLPERSDKNTGARVAIGAVATFILMVLMLATGHGGLFFFFLLLCFGGWQVFRNLKRRQRAVHTLKTAPELWGGDPFGEDTPAVDAPGSKAHLVDQMVWSGVFNHVMPVLDASSELKVRAMLENFDTGDLAVLKLLNEAYDTDSAIAVVQQAPQGAGLKLRPEMAELAELNRQLGSSTTGPFRQPAAAPAAVDATSAAPGREQMAERLHALLSLDSMMRADASQMSYLMSAPSASEMLRRINELGMKPTPDADAYVQRMG